MHAKYIIRIINSLLLFFVTINSWWFIALLIGIVGTWYFPYYLEFAAAGIAYDALFGMIPGMGVSSYLGTSVSILFFILILGMKSVLRK